MGCASLVHVRASHKRAGGKGLWSRLSQDTPIARGATDDRPDRPSDTWSAGVCGDAGFAHSPPAPEDAELPVPQDFAHRLGASGHVAELRKARRRPNSRRSLGAQFRSHGSTSGSPCTALEYGTTIAWRFGAAMLV